MSEAKIDKGRLLKGFAIKAIVTFISWVIIYYGFIIPDGRVNGFLTQSVIRGTTLGLSWLGYDTKGQGNMIFIDSQPVVLVADACNGLELFALYIGFLLCFPGKWKYKLIFITIGVFFLYAINVIREIVLALNYKFFQESFDFNHKYTYVFIVYLFVFSIWRFWLNRYSILAKN